MNVANVVLEIAKSCKSMYLKNIIFYKKIYNVVCICKYLLLSLSRTNYTFISGTIKVLLVQIKFRLI